MVGLDIGVKWWRWHWKQKKNKRHDSHLNTWKDKIAARNIGLQTQKTAQYFILPQVGLSYIATGIYVCKIDFSQCLLKQVPFLHLNYNFIVLPVATNIIIKIY